MTRQGTAEEGPLVCSMLAKDTILLFPRLQAVCIRSTLPFSNP